VSSAHSPEILALYRRKCKTVIFPTMFNNNFYQTPAFSITSIVFIILKLNYGTLLAVVTVSIKSDLILPELQQQ